MPNTTPAAAVQIPAGRHHQLNPAASTVTFATRHMFGLAPVKGTFRLVSGQITIANPVTSSTVSAVIDAASFATGNPQRDKDVKSARFLHVRDHPQITFRSTELVRDGDAWRLRGQIYRPRHHRPGRADHHRGHRQRGRPADPGHYPDRPIRARSDQGQGNSRTPPGHGNHRPRNPQLSGDNRAIAPSQGESILAAQRSIGLAAAVTISQACGS